MSPGSSRFMRFWNELKRRKVFGVIATYAATAYIVIEVTNNLLGPLNLPDWIATLVVLLMLAGLPVAIILSWIFDITPAGIKKTESIEEAKKEEPEVLPSKRKLKASYLLNAILLITVIALVCWEIFRPTPLERLQASGDRLTIAVMPFRNKTNDSTWDTWQDGVQNQLISALSNIKDLEVRQQENTNKLLNPNGLIDYASISPAVARSISRKLDADIFIYGDILKGGSLMRFNTQLVDTRTRSILKSIEIDGLYQGDYIFGTIDTLKKKVTEYLIISKLIKQFSSEGVIYTNVLNPSTTSADAFKCYMHGKKAFLKGDLPLAREWYRKALKADSGFFDAAMELAWAYDAQGMKDSCLKLVAENYRNIDNWSSIDQLRAKCNYATYFEPPEVAINILEQVLELDDQLTYMHGWLGDMYRSSDIDKAISEYEKIIEISRRWGKQFLKDLPVYSVLINCYIGKNEIKKAKKLLKEAERNSPNSMADLYLQHTWISFTEKDTAMAIQYYRKFMQLFKEKNPSYSKADSVFDNGFLYGFLGKKDSAESSYRRGFAMDPDDPFKISLVATRLEGEAPELFDFNEYSGLIDKLLESTKDRITYYNYLDRKGWTFYQKGRPKEALEILQKVWGEAPYKFYSYRTHLEEVKKAAKEKGIL